MLYFQYDNKENRLINKSDTNSSYILYNPQVDRILLGSFEGILYSKDELEFERK